MALTRQLAAQHAQQKYREASSWWSAFDIAIHRYRAWTLLYIARTRAANDPKAAVGYLNGKASLVRKALSDRADEAHDRMLIEIDNIWSAARCAVAAELAGRIYYEEYEELETGDKQLPYV